MSPELEQIMANRVTAKGPGFTQAFVNYPNRFEINLRKVGKQIIFQFLQFNAHPKSNFKSVIL